MTYQECIWKGSKVMPYSLMSKSGKLHLYVRKYIGFTGTVLKESKNGMLLVRFKTHTRAIPAGCLMKVEL